MDSRLERAAAFVLREADADRSISFDELKDYHIVPVAVMAELRAALAAPEPAPAAGDVHTWERPSRVWVVAWPNARSAHFTEEARDHAADPMPNGNTPVVTEYVPAAIRPAQAVEAVAALDILANLEGRLSGYAFCPFCNAHNPNSLESGEHRDGCPLPDVADALRAQRPGGAS